VREGKRILHRTITTLQLNIDGCDIGCPASHRRSPRARCVFATLAPIMYVSHRGQTSSQWAKWRSERRGKYSCPTLRASKTHQCLEISKRQDMRTLRTQHERYKGTPHTSCFGTAISIDRVKRRFLRKGYKHGRLVSIVDEGQDMKVCPLRRAACERSS